MSFRFWLSIVLVTGVVFVTSEAVTVQFEARIVGGAESHVINFPYQVSIRRKSCSTCAHEQFASGAIYSKNVIITSANAVRTETAKSLIVVAGTSYRTASSGLVYPVEEIIFHEDFQALTLNNDIALVKLKADLPLGELSTVQALKIAEVVPSAGTVGLIAGWGQTSETSDYSETIQFTRVPIVSQESCQSSYKFSTISESMVCAGRDEGGSDACKGDAGSPLVVANEFVGLASWGVGCARPNNPGVYTNLVILKPWIEDKLIEV